MDEEILNIDIKIPFPDKHSAEIAYNVLRVEKEIKRGGVKKEISFKDNNLLVNFQANLARQLRVSVNSFLESVRLIVETFEFNDKL